MLSLTRSQLRNLALGVGMLLLSAVVVVRALSSRSASEASGNPARPAATLTMAVGNPSPTAVSYPGPGATTYPGPGETLTAPAPQIHYSPFIATPLPDERVVVGPIVEIPESQDIPSYTHREDYIWKEGKVLDRIFVQSQGQEIRLGDDSGGSHLEATSEKYVTWRYLALHGDETNLLLKSGLYLYEIRNGQLTQIAEGRKVGFSELDGEWILYTLWENSLSANQFPGGETPGDLVSLLAYHIASGKTITLTTRVPVILGRGLQSFYGISGNRAGWIEYDMQTQQYTLKVCDLNSGKIRALNVPTLTHPLSFSFSGDLVVWRDPYWHGYSLTQDALFTIPHAPPGWETRSVNIWVTANQSALEWQVEVSSNETRYFRAPVIPRGQGATAWESFVPGRRSPFTTPTPLLPPTAYP